MGAPREKSLKTLLDHFASVQAKEIARAGDAVLNADWNGFQSIVDAASKSEIVASIHDLVTSSKASFDELIRELESTFDPQVWKFVCGGVMVGVGGGALASSATLAAALSLSTLTIQILAIALILWGLSLVLSVIWERVSTIIGDLRTS